jgi:hypothetical protein
MMNSINFNVDEIVTSCDAALTYTYIHLARKTRSEELEGGIRLLAARYGVMGSLVFGYETVAVSSFVSSDLIQDHPGFRVLVQHESDGNESFHRWTAEGYSGVNRGYNLLKARLLAQSTSQTPLPPSGAGASAGVEETDNDEPDSGTSGTEPDDRGRSKRQRNASPGRDVFSVDAVMGMVSSAVTSAVSSSGSAVASAFASERDEVKREQQRREHAENRIREMTMELKLQAERRRIEEEVALKYEGDLKEARTKMDEELRLLKEVVIVGSVCKY